ncbi:MAG: LrgB family protein [Clostridia bacterium]|nr:LrgB family protein [Clostridia bacterium]
MLELTGDPIFGFALCIGTYSLAAAIKRRFNYTILNPMLLSALMIIVILLAFKIPLKNFMAGGNFIAMFLTPATAALAVSMYHQLGAIKRNFIPILVGSVVGAASSIASIILLCRLFNLTPEVTASLIPKSITNAFATKLAVQLGGIVPITVAGVCVTGVSGSILAPYFVKWFRVNDPVATGLAIGASSHILGTSKAIEMGEVEGTISGIAVGLCGLATIIIGIFL